MKIKNIVLSVIILVVLSAFVYSITKSVNLVQLTDDVSIEKIDDCKTIYWDEEEPIYETCTNVYTEITCSDPPINQSCTSTQKSYDYECQKSTRTVTKSKEVCNDNALNIEIKDALQKYQLEYADFGKCSYENENDNAIIVCDSNLDGNGDGKCQSGESCVKFIVNKDGVQKLLRNSGNEYLENDKTFRVSPLNMEVTE